MGRTKSRKAQALAAAATKTAVASTSNPAPSIPSLLLKAQDLVTQCDYDLAEKFLQRVLEREPNHFEGREMLGLVELERGEFDSARELFASLVPPSPTAPNPPLASAYLYLAQLADSDPHAALAHYRTAVDILALRLKENAPITDPKDPGHEEQQETRRTLIRALVGMVEIWMTDLCFEDGAEAFCDSLLALALQTDPHNAEALQALASVRISQNRPDEAKEYVERSWAVWKDLEPDDPSLPPLSSRLTFVRLLLELSLFAPALTVLQDILAVDDEEVEAWYLEGWCLFLMAQRSKETGEKVEDLSWEELARDALECLHTCRTLFQNQNHEDDQILQHVKELIQDLQSLGISPSTENDNDPEGSDNDWEDESDDDVHMS